jgi:uncharacterized membrane protein YedE/YeeE
MSALPVIATALPVGIAFGVVLERAGLGDVRVIRGQLVGRDFTVILVMFGAIVTAMLGVLWVDALGLMPSATVATPPTDLAGQVVGAIIFGGGFGIAALCPGTACVAAASGRRDGVAAVAGVFAGTLLTFIPATGDFVNAELLGGTEARRVIGNAVRVQFLDRNDYPSAAAISFVLMAIIAGLVLLYAKFLDVDDLV